MRIIFVLSAAAMTALPFSASAQDFGGIIDDITDELEEAVTGSASEAPTNPILEGSAASGEHSRHWQSATRSRFYHVLEGAPGPYRLTIRATTTAPGGETVAVYPQTTGGERGSPRIGFVIATTVGNAEEIFVTIPRPPEGETQGRLPIIVDVENASGREYAGDYSLELEPVG